MKNIYERLGIQSEEAITNELLEFVYNKYNVELTPIVLNRGYTYELVCYVTGGDPIADRVRVQRTKIENVFEYGDTYFGFVIREDVEAEILAMCSDIDVPMKAFYPSEHSYYNNIFDDTKTYADLKQWIEDGNPGTSNITIVLSLENAEETETYSNRVFESLENAGFRGLVGVLSLPSEGFARVNRTNIDDLNREYNYNVKTKLFSKSIN
jgi:hypothetical protein